MKGDSVKRHLISGTTNGLIGCRFVLNVGPNGLVPIIRRNSGLEDLMLPSTSCNANQRLVDDFSSFGSH